MRRRTSAAQLLLFSTPAAQAAGCTREETEARVIELTAQLARKFGVGWATRSDMANAARLEQIEHRRQRQACAAEAEREAARAQDWRCRQQR